MFKQKGNNGDHIAVYVHTESSIQMTVAAFENYKKSGLL